jgi:integrase
MAERIARLKQKQIEHARPDKGRRSVLIADGGNLYLQATVGKDGSINRSWIFRFEMDGERHDLGLGPLFTLGAADARRRALELRQLIKAGIDPMAAKQEIRVARLAARAQQAKATTFKQCAEMYLNVHADRWKNPKHRAQWRSTLQTYAYPVIGELAVGDVEESHLLKVLQPIWKKIPETASRLRARIENVLGYATASRFRHGDNPARWRGHPKTLLGGAPKEVEHHPALPFAEAPGFMAELRKRDSVSAKALEFTILACSRTGETIGATWDEIDLKKSLWVIPAERMKADREHRVPLSDRAVEILESLPRRSAYVFTGTNKEPLSNMAMLQMIRGMRPGLTVHGLRSTFRDWAAERTSYPEFVIEMALAHRVGDDVVKAYKRTDLFERRVRLMKQWADFLAKPTKVADAVSIDEERAKRCRSRH